MEVKFHGRGGQGALTSEQETAPLTERGDRDHEHLTKSAATFNEPLF
jgi:hypothetical protein